MDYRSSSSLRSPCALCQVERTAWFVWHSGGGRRSYRVLGEAVETHHSWEHDKMDKHVICWKTLWLRRWKLGLIRALLEQDWRLIYETYSLFWCTRQREEVFCMFGFLSHLFRNYPVVFIINSIDDQITSPLETVSTSIWTNLVWICFVVRAFEVGSPDTLPLLWDQYRVRDEAPT